MMGGVLEMPLALKGVYFSTDGEEKAYEVESSYYLNYHLISAIFSLEKIRVFEKSSLLSKQQYYHYYTDHLMFSWGQIASRFLAKDYDERCLAEAKRSNRQNYLFSKDTFPLLSNKRARNILEHLDEYNVFTISELKGVGGFNLIDEETGEDLIHELSSRRTTHPYTLNLRQREIWLYDQRASKKININIEQLEAEIHLLQKNVLEFLEHIHL